MFIGKPVDGEAQRDHRFQRVWRMAAPVVPLKPPQG